MPSKSTMPTLKRGTYGSRKGRAEKKEREGTLAEREKKIQKAIRKRKTPILLKGAKGKGLPKSMVGIGYTPSRVGLPKGKGMAGHFTREELFDLGIKDPAKAGFQQTGFRDVDESEWHAPMLEHIPTYSHLDYQYGGEGGEELITQPTEVNLDDLDMMGVRPLSYYEEGGGATMLQTGGVPYSPDAMEDPLADVPFIPGGATTHINWSASVHPDDFAEGEASTDPTRYAADIAHMKTQLHQDVGHSYTDREGKRHIRRGEGYIDVGMQPQTEVSEKGMREIRQEITKMPRKVPKGALLKIRETEQAEEDDRLALLQQEAEDEARWGEEGAGDDAPEGSRGPEDDEDAFDVDIEAEQALPTGVAVDLGQYQEQQVEGEEEGVMEDVEVELGTADPIDIGQGELAQGQGPQGFGEVDALNIGGMDIDTGPADIETLIAGMAGMGGHADMDIDGGATGLEDAFNRAIVLKEEQKKVDEELSEARLKRRKQYAERFKGGDHPPLQPLAPAAPKTLQRQSSGGPLQHHPADIYAKRTTLASTQVIDPLAPPHATQITDVKFGKHSEVATAHEQKQVDKLKDKVFMVDETRMDLGTGGKWLKTTPLGDKVKADYLSGKGTPVQRRITELLFGEALPDAFMKRGGASGLAPTKDAIEEEAPDKYVRKKPTKKNPLGAFKLDKDGNKVLSKAFKDRIYGSGKKWDERYIKEVVTGARSREKPTQPLAKEVGETIKKQETIKTAEGEDLRSRWKVKTGKGEEKEHPKEYKKVHELEVLKEAELEMEARRVPFGVSHKGMERDRPSDYDAWAGYRQEKSFQKAGLRTDIEGRPISSNEPRAVRKLDKTGSIIKLGVVKEDSSYKKKGEKVGDIRTTRRGLLEIKGKTAERESEEQSRRHIERKTAEDPEWRTSAQRYTGSGFGYGLHHAEWDDLTPEEKEKKIKRAEEKREKPLLKEIGGEIRQVIPAFEKTTPQGQYGAMQYVDNPVGAVQSVAPYWEHAGVWSLKETDEPKHIKMGHEGVEVGEIKEPPLPRSRHYMRTQYKEKSGANIITSLADAHGVDLLKKVVVGKTKDTPKGKMYQGEPDPYVGKGGSMAQTLRMQKPQGDLPMVEPSRHGHIKKDEPAAGYVYESKTGGAAIARRGERYIIKPPTQTGTEAQKKGEAVYVRGGFRHAIDKPIGEHQEAIYKRDMLDPELIAGAEYAEAHDPNPGGPPFGGNPVRHIGVDAEGKPFSLRHDLDVRPNVPGADPGEGVIIPGTETLTPGMVPEGYTPIHYQGNAELPVGSDLVEAFIADENYREELGLGGRRGKTAQKHKAAAKRRFIRDQKRRAQRAESRGEIVSQRRAVQELQGEELVSWMEAHMPESRGAQPRAVQDSPFASQDTRPQWKIDWEAGLGVYAAPAQGRPATMQQDTDDFFALGAAMEFADDAPEQPFMPASADVQARPPTPHLATMAGSPPSTFELRRDPSGFHHFAYPRWGAEREGVAGARPRPTGPDWSDLMDRRRLPDPNNPLV